MRKIFILALLLCAGSAHAQSFIQYNQTAGTNASLTVAYTTQNDAAGNCTIVIASWKPNNGGVPTGVPTDSEGNTYVQDGAALNHGTGNASTQFWHSCGIVGGTKSTVTYHNDGLATVEVQIAEIHGVDSLDQVSRTASGTGTLATAANLTTTHANEILINGAAVNPANSTMFTAGDAAFTTMSGINGTYYSQYKATSSTGTFGPTATLSPSDDWVTWTSSYYQSGGGGAPANTALPTISTGSFYEQTATLTAANGSWTNSPTSFSYQWQRCGYIGQSCANIGGATSQTYVLANADGYNQITVQVTATNGSGNATATAPNTPVVTGFVLQTPGPLQTPKVH